MSKKDEYIEKAKGILDEQIAKMDALKAKAKEEISDQTDNAQKVIDELEEKINEAKSSLGDLTDAAEDTWESVKDKFEGISDNIGGSIKNLFHWDKEEKPDEVEKKADSKSK